MVEEEDNVAGSKERDSTKPNSWSERVFRSSVFFAFYWIMFGVCIIYGLRLYFDQPPHPSFMPVILISFSVVTSFIVVLTLNYVVGEIKFNIPGMNFEGASGPIVLWILCFLSVATALNMLYTESETTAEPHSGIAVHELWGRHSILKTNEGAVTGHEKEN